MRSFDLCVIGSGSGNSIVDERFAHSSVALVERSTFGGTCLNVGCIPTKMYVYPADLAVSPAQARELGVDLTRGEVHWAQIRDRIFGRIDPISAAGRTWRADAANVTLFEESAAFVAPKTVRVGEETFTAESFVLAAGSRPVIPDIPGLDTVTHHTSDTVMRLPELPGSLAIIGGGYIAAEFAHVFSAFGTTVTVLGRGPVLLKKEDAAVAARFTELLGRRVDLRLSSRVQRVEPGPGGGVRVHFTDATGAAQMVDVDVLLIATGRTSNADTLALDAAGVDVDDQGFIVVDEYQRTTAAGIFALGDVSSHTQLKHVANHEARVVQHNLLHPDELVRSDHRYIPHAVFSDPQVASVGLTEEQAKKQGLDYLVGQRAYGETAYGWAMEDSGHFVKVLADRQSGLLLGAHLIGPQASSLIQPLIQAMSFGLKAHDVARGQYWIHPAMAEVVENSLLALE